MSKAVFFDIDGTILDEKNYIPQSTVEGIRRLQGLGNYAFLCTGRSRAFVKNRSLLDIGFDGIVSGCGTMIEFHDRVLYYKMLEKEQVRRTVAFFKKHQVSAIMEGRYHLFLDDDDFGDDPYVKKLRKEMGGKLLPITGQEALWEVSKFSCAIGRADTGELEKGLGDSYELIFHDAPIMEVVPKGCSKGTGILRVCEFLEIPVSESYAVGDSANDLPMFEVAGYSIAMGNGTENVKQRASYVTSTLHEDGIYHALEHYALV